MVEGTMRRLIFGIIIGALLAGGLTFGVSQAFAQDEGQTFYGCLSGANGGTLSEVEFAPHNCGINGVTAVSWNAQGRTTERAQRQNRSNRSAGTGWAAGRNRSNGSNRLAGTGWAAGAGRAGDPDLRLDGNHFEQRDVQRRGHCVHRYPDGIDRHCQFSVRQR